MNDYRAQPKESSLTASQFATSGCAAAGRQAEIPTALEDLARTIHRMREDAGVLQNRLNPIMRNEPIAGDNQKQLRPEPRPDVMLAAAIRNLNTNLQATEEIYNDIGRRLEI